MKSLGFCFYRLPAGTEILRIEGEVLPFEEDMSEVSGWAISSFNGDRKWFIKGTPVVVDAENVNGELWQHQVGEIPMEEQDACLQRIEESVKLTRNGKLKKLVAARTKWLSGPLNKNLFQLFEILCREYGDAFVYLCSTPETGTWLGASPELLFWNRGMKAETVALAGTRRQSDLRSFEKKEIEEQQWVLKFLLESLENQGCNNISSGELTNRKAGHLTHLVNVVSFELPSTSKRWNLIEALHPTPAVSGYPQKESISTILQLEPFDRFLYSGYLGPFSPEGADIFVNLRCMQCFKEGALLYAGAGITPDSVPEDEYQEMEEKMNILMKWM